MRIPIAFSPYHTRGMAEHDTTSPSAGKMTSTVRIFRSLPYHVVQQVAGCLASTDRGVVRDSARNGRRATSAQAVLLGVQKRHTNCLMSGASFVP